MYDFLAHKFNLFCKSYALNQMIRLICFRLVCNYVTYVFWSVKSYIFLLLCQVTIVFYFTYFVWIVRIYNIYINYAISYSTVLYDALSMYYALPVDAKLLVFFRGIYCASPPPLFHEINFFPDELIFRRQGECEFFVWVYNPKRCIFMAIPPVFM